MATPVIILGSLSTPQSLFPQHVQPALGTETPVASPILDTDRVWFATYTVNLSQTNSLHHEVHTILVGAQYIQTAILVHNSSIGGITCPIP